MFMPNAKLYRICVAEKIKKHIISTEMGREQGILPWASGHDDWHHWGGTATRCQGWWIVYLSPLQLATLYPSRLAFHKTGGTLFKIHFWLKLVLLKITLFNLLNLCYMYPIDDNCMLLHTLEITKWGWLHVASHGRGYR
ncbi:hypothetical protein ACJX0J_012315, partial [Zea mays]